MSPPETAGPAPSRLASVRAWNAVALILATALVCWPPGWAGGLPELDRALRIGWGNLFLTPAFYGLVLLFILLGKLVARSRGGTQDGSPPPTGNPA